MKFLWFGDSHYRATTPENRMDDFVATHIRKTKEIIQLGREHEVSAFFQAGDFFDAPNPGLDFAGAVMEMWTGKKSPSNLHDTFRKFKEGTLTEKDVMKAIKGDTIPLIGVAGNHELYGNNISTLAKTQIGYLNKMGAMKFATKENPYFFTTEDGLKIAVTGTHYHLDIDSPEHIDDYVVEEKLGDIHIHIVHGYLTDKSKGKMFRHTLIDQIKHTKADLTLTGHDHIGFPITEVGGKFFVNTGAVTRSSNDLKEMNRIVKVLLIECSKETGLRLKEIPLKSAVDGSLVLNRKKIVEKKDKAVRIEEFKKAVRDAGLTKATDITEIIRDLAENQKLPIQVKEEALKRISEKMSEMKYSLDGVVQEAYVNKIILENFQSHAYTELDCSKGFNVFVGESRQGKTAILRALDWVYENKPSGRRIVKKGTESARVTVFLSNGYRITRFIEAKKNGKNGYEITDPNTGEVTTYNTKILPEIQNILGFSNLVIDKDLQFNLNFLKQGTGWFLIGDQFTAPQKAKVIGGIYGTQFADAVIRDVDAETKKTNEQIKKANQSLMDTQKRMEEFSHLQELKHSIESMEKTIIKIEEEKQTKELIERSLAKRTVLVQSIEQESKIADELKDIDKTYLYLSKAKEGMEKSKKIEESLTKHNKTAESLKHLYHSLESLKDLDRAKKGYEIALNLLEKRNKVEASIRKREELSSQLSIQYQAIEATNEIDTAKDALVEIKELANNVHLIKIADSKHQQITQGLNEQELLLKQTEHIEEAESLLGEVNSHIMNRNSIEEKQLKLEALLVKKEINVKALDGISLTVKSTASIENARSMLEEIKQLRSKREQIVTHLVSRGKTQLMIEQEEKQIEEAMVQTKKEVSLYQNVLEQAGQCPVCFGTIDKATVNRIVSNYTKTKNTKGACTGHE